MTKLEQIAVDQDIILTRMEIARLYAECAVNVECTVNSDDILYERQIVAICEMALRYLAMQPRPISEAPKDGTHILAFFNDGITPPTTLHWFGPADLPGLRGGGWYVSVQEIDSGRRYHPTHFIPLSSFPEPKG